MTPELEELKRQVIDATDIAAVIGQSVTLKKAGANYSGLCPFHEEKTGSFTVPSAKKFFKCFGCGEGGNVIDFIVKYEKKSFFQALNQLAAEAGIEGVKGERQARKKETLPQLPKEEKTSFSPTATRTPAENWKARAAKLVNESHEKLIGNDAQMEWLAVRGISHHTVVKFQLGWTDILFRPRKAWGLPEEFLPPKNGKVKPKMLLIPKGLVIPCMSGDTIHRVTIRQAEPKNPKKKYMNIKGCGNSPLVILSTLPSHIWVIVESYLDALAIHEAAGDFINVMAMGSLSAKPDSENIGYLRDAALILNALDAEDKESRAYDNLIKTNRWWKDNFSNIKRWPVPKGKDPGGYIKDSGGDLRAWLIAGLPPALADLYLDLAPPKMTMDTATTENDDKDQNKKIAPPYSYIETRSGKTIVIMTEEPTRETLHIWKGLIDKGETVFRPGEVKLVTAAKLDALSVNMDGEIVADLFVHVKTLFGGETNIERRVDLRG